MLASVLELEFVELSTF